MFASCWAVTALALHNFLGTTSLAELSWHNFLNHGNRNLLQNGGTLRIVCGGSFRFASKNTSGKAVVNGSSCNQPPAGAQQMARPPFDHAGRHSDRPAHG